jgi:hypothetical protein
LGWVNELIARLEAKPWNASLQTSENSTLNADPTTFPVDRRFYVDFTHDSTITSVLAALALPHFDEVLKVPDGGKKLDANRNFKTSKVVPFAARLVLEVWQCADETSVRMKLNDAVVPLSQYTQCAQRPDGMCAKKDFLTALAQRNLQSEWQKCQA